jgi:pSer/pThr/pTyr-binding forkhead associated (FHA) protein/tetratricopeptide (TPR) repeat protein
MHKLIIQDDEGKTTVVPLIREEITIGRKEGNTIRLTERNVSRRHARIVKSNGSVFVEDLDSYNGVKVNGQRIQGRVPVTEQDRIQIGDYLLELRVDRGAQDGFGVASVTQTAPMEVVSASDLQSIPPSAMPPPIPMDAGNGHGQLMRPAGFAPGVGDGSAMSATTVPMPVAETPARLVVVSPNFAGREFILDKPAMVIGRTDDNDVVINHRSISRHHAKIVQEQGRYAVVDLQSANGVRVNGEEYGKVELRRGDVIDLGHVRLRYVEPGEDFVFERDGHNVGVAIRPKKSGGKGVLVGTLAVLCVAGVAGVIAATRQGSAVAVNPTAASPTPPTASPTPDPTPSEPVAAVKNDGPKVPTSVTDPPVKPSENPENPPPVAPDVAKLLEEAKAGLAEERWVSALAAAEQILKVDPQNVEAKKVQEKANAEFRNQTAYEKFVEQKDAGKITDAVKLYSDLPGDSFYRDKAKPAFEEMREGFIKDKEGEAKALKDKGQCDRIAPLARRTAEMFPEAKPRVEKAGAGCAAVAAREPKPDKPKPDKPPVAAPTEVGDVDTLRKEAQEAAKQHSWPTALKKAGEVLKQKPDDVDALVVSAMASCYLGDKGKALKYYDRLAHPGRKNMVKQICTQVNIMLDEGE